MVRKKKIQLLMQRLSMSLICIFFINTTIYAQGFMMSSVGNLATTSNNASAINFKSAANCIEVQSGIAVFNTTRNLGEFVVNCAIAKEFNALGLKMFPNPTKKSSIVKFINTPPLNDNFTVTVWTTDGTLISSRKETGYSLIQGITLDVTSLTSGTYLLKVESPLYLEAIKFIKAN